MHVPEDVQGILKKVKDGLAARGVSSIATFGRAFRTMDSYNSNKQIDAEEFRTGLAEWGVSITPAESTALMSYMDSDGSGTINIDEFLVALRGGLSKSRLPVVQAAFAKFDKDGSGQITKKDLYDVYSVEKHPKYISGEMSKDQIFNKFLTKFGDTNDDGIITYDEWLINYCKLSASIDNDEHFVLMMKNAWKLD